MGMIDKWKDFVEKMNSQGIPVPTMRDPKTKQGSVTFTLVVASAGACMISIAIMLGTSIAKLKGDFVLTAETSAQVHDAFASSFQFLIASLSAYLGRKMQKDQNGQITMSPDKEDEK